MAAGDIGHPMDGSSILARAALGRSNLDELEERLERLRRGMAQPMTAPENVRDADEFYRWLLKKQGEYRRREGSNDSKVD